MAKKNSTFFFMCLSVIVMGFLILYPNYVVKADTTSNVGVTYDAQVQNIGWQDPVYDGSIAGTQGQNLRLETLKISLTNALPGMYLTYQAHVQYKGWMNPVEDSQIAGTVGQSLRVEAIKIQLHNAPNYHIQYQAHVQNVGWQDWVQDGQQAGTTGKGLKIEALRIKIVKDSSAQTTYNSVYQTHVQNIGWQDWNETNDIAGTVGKGLGIEAIKLNIQNLQQGMSIKYQAHVQSIGWQDWVQNGQIAGTTGKNLHIEAFRAVLVGMSGYHIQYQAQVQNIGWMPWTQDGGDGGTTGRNLQLEAIRIQIVKDQPTTAAPQNVITQPTVSTSFLNNQSATLTGYAVNQYGNKEIDVYIDDAFAGKASTGLDSLQVSNSAYLNGTKSGYSFPIPLRFLGEGTHNIQIQAIGNDQTLNNQSISFNVHVLQPMICVDTPTEGTFIKNVTNQLPVVGWSLNAFGVSKVQIFVDNQYKGDSAIGGSRPDVNNVYPNYINGSNSGFNYNLDISSLTNGAHTLTVKSTGNDGMVTSSSQRIYKFYSDNQFTTNYNISESQLVDAQMALTVNGGAPVSDNNGNWVASDRQTVEYYVDPMNFMDSYGIYQFLSLSYIQGISADDLNKILQGRGVLSGKGAVFLAAGQNSNVNPIYLVSHAILETGSGTSTLATGVTVNGTKVYNMFGIHAFDSDPIKYGSQYAYDSNWTSVDAAIYGGAKWISTYWINSSQYKQNTLYKMRWNPASPGDHEYASDVRWAYNQVYFIKKLTDMCDNPSLQFDIPQFK